MEQIMFLDMRMTQRMVMTPRMQQAIKMLQMPTFELEALVEQELMENPVLEEVPTEDLQNAGSVEWDNLSPPADGNGKTEGDKLTEGKIELSDDWERFFEDGSDTTYVTIPSGFSAPLDEEFDRVIPDEVSLRDELERQL